MGEKQGYPWLSIESEKTEIGGLATEAQRNTEVKK